MSPEVWSIAMGRVRAQSPPNALDTTVHGREFQQWWTKWEVIQILSVRYVAEFVMYEKNRVRVGPQVRPMKVQKKFGDGTTGESYPVGAFWVE